MPKVKVGDINIHYQVVGEGEPILWIMGLGNDHAGWGYQVREFRDNFRCILSDNRDAGQTDRSQRAYSIRDMAEDIVGLMDALGVEKAHVVGWSMGGAIAQELAINYPERVGRLCLIATYHQGDPRGTERLEGFKKVREALGLEAYFQVSYPWSFTWRSYLQPGFVEGVKKRVLENPYTQDPAAFARQADATGAHDTADRLGQIKAPTLVLVGDEDVLTPMRFSKALADGIPNAILTVIAEAGHALLWEKPDEVNRVLGAFLCSAG